jgi:hypothetical protein
MSDLFGWVLWWIAAGVVVAGVLYMWFKIDDRKQ